MASRLPDEEHQAKSIMEVLVRHATVFGITAKSSEEWASLFGVYIETLWDLPPAAIEEAFARWNRGELYPKTPGGTPSSPSRRNCSSSPRPSGRSSAPQPGGRAAPSKRSKPIRRR
jgi:hypothetical protein